MEKVVTIFQFKQENITELRTVLCNGEPWFAAADVCKVLDIANVSDAVEKLDEDEKNTIALSDGNRGNPNILIVNESGLYHLIPLSEVRKSCRPLSEVHKFDIWDAIC